MIHTSGINRVLALLDAELTAAGVGTGTAPSVSDTQLTDELYRKPITLGVIDGNALLKDMFLDETEGNGTITEIGLFGAPSILSAGLGELFQSGGANITKDSTQSLTISFEIEVKEVS
jgi:hypothetical protein